jgi:hypothetical protein
MQQSERLRVGVARRHLALVRCVNRHTTSVNSAPFTGIPTGLFPVQAPASPEPTNHPRACDQGMAASHRSTLRMLQCSIVLKTSSLYTRGVFFHEVYSLCQRHGPEQVFKPRFRRPDRVRVDRHRQFARVPGSLACHLVQLARWPRQSASGESASQVRRLPGPISLGQSREFGMVQVSGPDLTESLHRPSWLTMR